MKTIIIMDRSSVMCTEIQINKISKQMSECYRSIYGNDIVAVFLYGSYAKGNFDDESDVDITAIVRGDRLDLQNKLKKVWDKSADIGIENDVVVSPTVIPFHEYEEYKETLPYYKNIWKEGKLIG